MAKSLRPEGLSYSKSGARERRAGLKPGAYMLQLRR
jgi:hypothetical protein